MILSGQVIKNTRGRNQITGWLRMAQGFEGRIKSDSQWLLVAGFLSLVSGHLLLVSGYWLPIGLSTASYVLRVASCGLRISGRTLRNIQ